MSSFPTTTTFLNYLHPQQLRGSKVSSQRKYCIYSEPITKAELNNKNMITNIQVCAYGVAPGKTRTNLPNQSRKMEYAAFTKQFGRTEVIHG